MTKGKIPIRIFYRIDIVQQAAVAIMMFLLQADQLNHLDLLGIFVSGEITILCIGPATNVALACQKDSTFAQNTAGIIYMGGSLEKTSSFNWAYDADAVKVCLESDFPKQTISFSITR